MSVDKLKALPGGLTTATLVLICLCVQRPKRFFNRRFSVVGDACLASFHFPHCEPKNWTCSVGLIIFKMKLTNRLRFPR